MFMLISILILSLSLSAIVLLLAHFLSIKSLLDTEKASPFECGFVPQANFRTPFSMHFFLIAIVFLIFDIELVLLFPYFSVNSTSAMSLELFLVVVILLTWGTFAEWSQTMLDWVNF